MITAPTSAPSNITRIILDDRKIIGYRPKLNALTGSMSATILLGQIMYWAEHSGNPFYKFMQPCLHAQYRAGDSWCEELGITRHEYDGAIRRIGQKLSKGISPAADALVWYWTDMNRLTWYQVNWAFVNQMIADVYAVMPESGNTYCGKAAIGNDEKRQDVKPESGFTYIEQRLTAETTQTITSASGPASPPLCPDDEDDLFSDLLEIGLAREQARQVLESHPRALVRQKVLDLAEGLSRGKVKNLAGYAQKVFGGELYPAKQAELILNRTAGARDGLDKVAAASEADEYVEPPLPRLSKAQEREFSRSLKSRPMLAETWRRSGWDSVFIRTACRTWWAARNTEDQK